MGDGTQFPEPLRGPDPRGNSPTQGYQRGNSGEGRGRGKHQGDMARDSFHHNSRYLPIDPCQTSPRRSVDACSAPALVRSADERPEQQREDTHFRQASSIWQSAGECRSVSDLARALGVDEETLRQLATRDRIYRHWPKEKPEGGIRWIDAPSDELKAIQRRLGCLLKPPDSAISYSRRGRGHVEAAARHRRASWVGTLDIRDFFPSVTSAHIRRIFAGLPHDLVQILVALTCLRGRLPQGSPASPILAELVLEPIDKRICERANRLGVIVTRYMDNFTVSGPLQAQVVEVRAFVSQELRSLGFRENRSKRTVECRAQAEVHGLRVRGRVSPPKSWRRELRQAVRRAATAPITREELNFLLGRIAYLAQFKRREAACLRKILVAGRGTELSNG